MDRAHDRRVHEIPVVLVGALIGVVFGVFGGGGAAFATPALALLGLPAVVAVASPLPAMLPAALAGARQYHRSGHLDRGAAVVAVVAGVPAVVLGALVSGAVGGTDLLVLSAALLLVAGLRMLVPVRAPRPVATTSTLATAPVAPAVTPRRRATVVALIAGAAFLSGMLANGGGSLLVPIFVLGLGLGMTRATGTSMLTVVALLVPTVLVHWSLGHIDWSVAAAFACGAVPATLLGTSLGRRLDDALARRLLGVLLVTFSLVFAATRLA